MDNSGTVLACFYRGTSPVDIAVREVCRRPGQPLGDVPSHCALAFPYSLSGGFGVLFEMTARGWVRRAALPKDFAWCYPVALPGMDACRAWCEGNRGRYRWWVDALILVMSRRWIRHQRVPGLLKRWHLAVRHICSVDALRALTEGGWPCPLWLAAQQCPASPNDLLFAVRETLELFP